MSDPTPTTAAELLKSQAHELVKQFIVYDGSSRPTDVYTAQLSAVTGTQCIRTTYTYSGSTSLVLKRKEYYDVWSSTYDI